MRSTILLAALLLSLSASGEVRRLESLKALHDNEGARFGFTRDLNDTNGEPFLRIGFGWEGQEPWIASHFKEVATSPVCYSPGGPGGCVAAGFPAPDDCDGLRTNLHTGEPVPSYTYAQHVHSPMAFGALTFPLRVIQADPMSGPDPTGWNDSGPLVTYFDDDPDDPGVYRIQMKGYGRIGCFPSGSTLISGQLLTGPAHAVRLRAGGMDHFPGEGGSRLRVAWILADGSVVVWVQPENETLFRNPDHRYGIRDFWLTRPEGDVVGFSVDWMVNYVNNELLGVWDVETWDEALPDADGDGVRDVGDNCQLVSNWSQCNTDNYSPFTAEYQDGEGNHCDGDFDNGGTVNGNDFSLFSHSFQHGSGLWRGTDMDCNGTVNGNDFDAHFVPQFQQGTPGPTCCT